MAIFTMILSMSEPQVSYVKYPDLKFYVGGAQTQSFYSANGWIVGVLLFFYSLNAHCLKKLVEMKVWILLILSEF